MKHILFDLKGCPSDLLDNEDFVRLCAWTAAKESKSELINISCHKFEPQGVTALAMLAESHLSIHTWPEKVLQNVTFLHVVISVFQKKQ